MTSITPAASSISSTLLLRPQSRLTTPHIPFQTNPQPHQPTDHMHSERLAFPNRKATTAIPSTHYSTCYHLRTFSTGAPVGAETTRLIGWYRALVLTHMSKTLIIRGKTDTSMTGWLSGGGLHCDTTNYFLHTLTGGRGRGRQPLTPEKSAMAGWVWDIPIHHCQKPPNPVPAKTSVPRRCCEKGWLYVRWLEKPSPWQLLLGGMGRLSAGFISQFDS